MNTIKEFTHPNLGVRMDVKNVVLSILLLVLGITLVVYSLNGAGASEYASVSLLVIGACSAVAAVLCYVSCGKSLYFLPTMAKVEFSTWYFEPEALSSLKTAISTGNFKALPQLNVQQMGNVRLDILKATDNTFAAIQLYQYAELMYAPQTEVRVMNVGEVEALVEHIKK